MKAIVNYLEQLGFSKTEIKLYLRLLSSGSMTVAELAEKAKMNRTAMYSYIKSLMNKGLITQVTGESNKIAANPPEQLQMLVEQKITAAHNLKAKLPTILNAITVSFAQQEGTNQSEIKYFKGKNGIKAIYSDVLKADKVRAYFSFVDLDKVLPENFQLFENALLNNPKMTIYELCEDSPSARKKVKEADTTNRHIYKFLPSDIKLTANDILIYDEKVAIVNLFEKEDIHGVIMSNKDYYNSSVQIFDLLWRLLPETKRG